MSSLLNPLQIALGVSSADLVKRDEVVIEINGNPHTVKVPSPPSGFTYWWADRTTNMDTLPLALAGALNLAEFDEGSGGLWTVEWDQPVLGYYRLKRNIGDNGDTITILWDDPSTTAVAQWWGFDQASNPSMSATVKDYIVSEYQCGMLWLPENFAGRWESRKIREGKTKFHPFGGKVHRFGLGGYTMWRLTIEEIAALFVYCDRSQREDYLCARKGVVLGDPNVSWEGGIWCWLYENNAAPLRVWRDREDLTTYEDVQVWRPEELDDMEDVWKETRRSPQRYSVEMFLVQGS